MVVYQLMLFSCLTITSLDGDLASKTCQWQAEDFYDHEALCQVNGAAKVGHPVFRDVGVINSEEKIERHRCRKVTIRTS